VLLGEYKESEILDSQVLRKPLNIRPETTNDKIKDMVSILINLFLSKLKII
jgi:hypothetical protein